MSSSGAGDLLQRKVVVRPAALVGAACVAAGYWYYHGPGIALIQLLIAVVVFMTLVCSQRAVAWTGRHLNIATGIIFLGMLGFLRLLLFKRGLPLYPSGHDQFMFLLQARQIASGRLWMHQHELADFFESFNIFTKPVYASIYFPGTSLFLAIGMVFGLPYVTMPLLIASGVAAMLFRVVAEILDAGLGLLAALMLPPLALYQNVSNNAMATSSLTLLALLMYFAWLQFRKKNQLGWAIVFGAFAGWAAITRPVDALAYGIPIAVVMLWETRKLTVGRKLAIAGCVVAAAAPFISLQLIADKGVTGSIFKTPWEMYGQVTWGIKNQYGISGGAQPQEYVCGSTLPQIVMCQKTLVLPEWRRLESETRLSAMKSRGRVTLSLDSPNPYFLLLVPIGLCAAFWNIRRIPLAMELPLFLLGYSLFGQFWPYYAMPAQPSVIFLIVLGVHGVAGLWPRQQWTVRALLAGPIILTCLMESPAVRLFGDRQWPGLNSEALAVDRSIEANIHHPAVVLFRFHPSKNTFQYEPVYNVGAASPDAAQVIRAHDLGTGRDWQLIQYYAKIQPQRELWVFDRGDGSIHYAGVIGDLAKIPAGQSWLPKGLADFQLWH